MLPRDTIADCADLFLGCNPRPTLVTPGLNFRQIGMSPGFLGHLCGLTLNYKMYCWGDMLVTYDLVVDVGRAPVRYGPTEPIQTMSVGPTHDCAVTAGGDTYCWGDYDFNVRGTGGPVEHDWDMIPNLVAGGWTFQVLASGGAHSCGLEQNGEALCWGHPARVGLANPPVRTGECGLPLTCVDHPVRVAGFRPYRQLESGGGVTCGIDIFRRLYCWGSNGSGSVGDGTTVDRTEPVHIAFPAGVVTVSVGGGHSCAITTRATTYCWGSNYSGQLGTGQTSPFITSPTVVAIEVPLQKLATSAQHTCGLDEDGVPWCWGSNQYGQLGTADTLRSAVPRRVAAPQM